MTLLTKIEADRQESIMEVIYTTVLSVLGNHHSDDWERYIQDPTVEFDDSNPAVEDQ
jgi:hypothetical protein